MARLNADTLVKTLTGAGALAVAALVIAMGAMLIGGASEALQHFGPAFLTSSEWDPVKQHFGAVPSLVGTLVTATLSLLFAVPLALGIAVFLTELAPAWLVTPASLAVELMAAIPSIIYGMWGLFVLAPLLAESVLPPLQKALDWLPFFQGAPTGIGVLPASFVLSLMVVPYIAAVARDLFGMVPSQLKEAATGVGATRWEVVRYVVLPHTKLGLVGAVILGLGRALGETMAVTFVIGNSHKLSSSLLAPGSTIASTLANEFTEATDDLHLSALLALALVLYVLSVVILGLGRLLVVRTTQQNARS